jgi:hypothetical protein
MYSSQKENSLRYGMYKNYRVGCIKYYNKPTSNQNACILVEVVEYCIGSSGHYYASYNLNIEIDSRFTDMIGMHSVGKWIMFGFYIQSFKIDNSFVTALRLRHYEEVESDVINTVEIVDFRNNDTRLLLVPEKAVNYMKEITDKTKFQEYGKR